MEPAAGRHRRRFPTRGRGGPFLPRPAARPPPRPGGGRAPSEPRPHDSLLAEAGLGLGRRRVLPAQEPGRGGRRHLERATVTFTIVTGLAGRGNKSASGSAPRPGTPHTAPAQGKIGGSGGRRGRGASERVQSALPRLQQHAGRGKLVGAGGRRSLLLLLGGGKAGLPARGRECGAVLHAARRGQGGAGAADPARRGPPLPPPGARRRLPRLGPGAAAAAAAAAGRGRGRPRVLPVRGGLPGARGAAAARALPPARQPPPPPRLPCPCWSPAERGGHCRRRRPGRGFSEPGRGVGGGSSSIGVEGAEHLPNGQQRIRRGRGGQ